MFTDPPLAHVGLSEGDAERQGVIVRVARLPVDSVLRAQATGERQGLVKALVAENDDRILGFTMIGAAAGEVMAVVQMTMLAGAPYGRLADAILAHPTDDRRRGRRSHGGRRPRRRPAPALAHVGLSEGDAERQGVIVRVARLPVDSVLRAQATGERQGFMKVLVGENDDRILGFTMIGAAAGEVMAVVQIAMLAAAPYGRLADAILAHPTMAEGLGMLFSNVPRRSLQRVTPERAA